jgi:hypothetical protein
MAASWKTLCNNRAFHLDGNGFSVELGEARHHRVVVEESEDALLLRSVVMGPADIERANLTATRIWEMNRALTLVGFRIDTRNRLVGEASIPRAGLTANDFQAIALNLAAECDRYEFMFTGRDQE